MEKWRQSLCKCTTYVCEPGCPSAALDDDDIADLCDYLYSYVRTLFDLEVGSKAVDRRIPVVSGEDPE